MSPKLKELATLLAELENLCDRMIILTGKERKALIDQHIENLNLVAESKNALSQKIALARDRARELILELAPLGGTGVRTVERLLPLLSEQEKRILAGSYEAYKAKAGQVEFHNAHNMILAKQGLKAIEGRVAEMVSAIQGAEATYKRPGRTMEPAPPRVGRVHREA